MALSNWDIIAWNEKGEPTKGITYPFERRRMDSSINK